MWLFILQKYQKTYKTQEIFLRNLAFGKMYFSLYDWPEMFFFLNKYSTKEFEGIPNLDKATFSILENLKNNDDIAAHSVSSCYSGRQIIIPRARTDCHLG